MKLTAELKGDLAGALDRMVSTKAESVIYSGAAAMARVVYEEVRENTSGSKAGMPGKVTGNLHESIYWVKDDGQSSPLRAVYNISWNKSKAPHGHLLEFGTSRMPAIPFLRPAASRLPEALKAGQARMQVVWNQGRVDGD
jgi:HK97 gp10 family phage protein